jgi:hypothetical protein
MTQITSTIGIKLVPDFTDLDRAYTSKVAELQSKVVPIRFRAQAEDGGGGPSTFAGGGQGGAYTPRSYAAAYRPSSVGGPHAYRGGGPVGDGADPYAADVQRVTLGVQKRAESMTRQLETALMSGFEAGHKSVERNAATSARSQVDDYQRLFDHTRRQLKAADDYRQLFNRTRGDLADEAAHDTAGGYRQDYRSTVRKLGQSEGYRQLFYRTRDTLGAEEEQEERQKAREQAGGYRQLYRSTVATLRRNDREDTRLGRMFAGEDARLLRALESGRDEANRKGAAAEAEGADDGEGAGGGGGGGKKSSVWRKLGLFAAGKTFGFPGLGLLNAGGASTSAAMGVAGGLAATYAIHKVIQFGQDANNVQLGSLLGGAKGQIDATLQMGANNPGVQLQNLAAGLGLIHTSQTQTYKVSRAAQNVDLVEASASDLKEQSGRRIRAMGENLESDRMGYRSGYARLRREAADERRMRTLELDAQQDDLQLDLRVAEDLKNPNDVFRARNRLENFKEQRPMLNSAARRREAARNDATDFAEGMEIQGTRASTRLTNLKTSGDSVGAAFAAADAKYVPVRNKNGKVVAIQGVYESEDAGLFKTKYDAYTAEKASNYVDLKLFELGSGMGLSSQKRQLERGIARDPIGAQAEGIVGGAEQNILGFLRGEHKDLAEQARNNGLLSMTLLRQQYTDAFRAESFDPRQYQAANPKDTQDPGAVFQQLEKGFTNLQTAVERIETKISDLVAN